MNFAAAILNGPAPPEKTALLTKQGDVSYGELRRRAGQMAEYLRSRGLQPGDRVLLMGESSSFWVQAYLGIALAGGVSVPLPVPIKPTDLAQVIAETTPRMACVQERWLCRLAPDLEACEVVIAEEHSSRIERAVEVVPLEAEEIATAASVAKDDLAAIMFTSGSTAKPRGVMVSHGNILANTADIIASLQIGAADRMMAVLPLHYCFGASLLHTHLSAGASLVIDNRFLFPDKVLQNMIDTACTSLAGVPSTFQILLRRSHFKTMRFPALTKLQQAGGALAASDIEELEAALPQAELYVMYGQTEATARLSCISPAERRRRPGSIGRGLPHCALRVVDESDQPVRPDVVGEIVADGPNITLGYWRDDEATARIYRNGLRTGDLATADSEGFVTIVDRARDFLKCGGKRVSCREIEETVGQHPGVVDVVALGVPDEILGEAVCLFVVHPKGAAIEVSLREYCARELEFAVQPQQIVMLTEVPQTSSGKPDKTALRKSLARPGKGVQA